MEFRGRRGVMEFRGRRGPGRSWNSGDSARFHCADANRGRIRKLFFAFTSWLDHTPLMKLYGSLTSPFVRHCRMALLQTGIECEFVETDVATLGRKTPTLRIPYLEDDNIQLSDSTSILRYIREKAGDTSHPDVEELDLYCLANTVLDTGINVFLFARFDSLTPDQSKYLTRQNQRIEAGLDELEQRDLPGTLPLTDAHLRVAALLDWGLFRERFKLEGRPRLDAFLQLALSSEEMQTTTPPGWRQ